MCTGDRQCELKIEAVKSKNEPLPEKLTKK